MFTTYPTTQTVPNDDASGHQFCPGCLARSAPRLGGLTESERAIAIAAASGATNKSIASQLFVSVKTVESHLSSTFRKLSVRNRTELASRLIA
jgi:DNA-binding NarL/FixJ family response regulator